MKGAFEFVFETVLSFFILIFLVICLFNGIVEQQAQSLLSMAVGTLEHYNSICAEAENQIAQQKICNSCEVIMYYCDNDIYDMAVEVNYPYRLITLVKIRKLQGYVKKRS